MARFHGMGQGWGQGSVEGSFIPVPHPVGYHGVVPPPPRISVTLFRFIVVYLCFCVVGVNLCLLAASQPLCTYELKRVVGREQGRRAAEQPCAHNFGSMHKASARGACPLLAGGAIAALVVRDDCTSHCVNLFTHQPTQGACFLARFRGMGQGWGQGSMEGSSIPGLHPVGYPWCGSTPPRISVTLFRSIVVYLCFCVVGVNLCLLAASQPRADGAG